MSSPRAAKTPSEEKQVVERKKLSDKDIFSENYSVASTISETDDVVVRKIKLANSSYAVMKSLIGSNKENFVYEAFYTLQFKGKARFVEFIGYKPSCIVTQHEPYCLSTAMYQYDTAIKLEAGGCPPLLSHPDRLQLADDLASAIEEMQRLGVAHNDLKPENILLTADKRAKVCDFGSACNYGSTQEQLCGTKGYRALELYEVNQPNDKSDIFSFGVTIAQLFCGKGQHWMNLHVFNKDAQYLKGLAQAETLQKNLVKAITSSSTGFTNETLSGEFKTFLTDCIGRDPKKRPGLSAIKSFLQTQLSLWHGKSVDADSGEPKQKPGSTGLLSKTI